jgi:hypothetical protein
MPNSNPNIDFENSPEPAAVLDELGSSKDAVLLLTPSRKQSPPDHVARLGGGPAYFTKKVERPNDSPPWKTIGREAAVRLVREWEVVSLDTPPDWERYSTGDWVQEYQTATVGNERVYPAPCDWTIEPVSEAGWKWQRNAKSDHSNPDSHDVSSTPDDVAFLDFDPPDSSDIYGPTEVEEVTFSVNGDPIFQNAIAPRDIVLTAVADVLQRISNGVDYPSTLTRYRESDQVENLPPEHKDGIRKLSEYVDQ